jgi:hypothetical protein
MPNVTDIGAWLRGEATKHCDLLTKLRERLLTTIDSDITENGTPSRDWCRAYGRYQTGIKDYLAEERERAKLSLLANKGGQEQLTDEQYREGLRQFALESIGEASDTTLKAELERRGLKVVAVDEGEDE